MSKRFLITLITLIVIGIAAAVAIFFAKGYTVSTKEKRIIGTGIVTVTSEPDAASVFVDGHLTTATNATISSLPAKTYSIKLTKEGFIPWEKAITVKEGIVTDLKVTLFPAIPTIYPLTFTGVANPVLSPDGSKLSYIVTSGKKAGVWVWTLSRNQPIAFARASEPHQIASNTTADFSKAVLVWSSDSKQVLASSGQNNYLLDADRLNSDPRDITAVLSTTEKTWEEDTKIKDQARILNIKDLAARKLASSAAILKWAPDETKFMYHEKGKGEPFGSAQGESEKSEVKDETQIKFKVYDLETKKNYDLPEARAHYWLPDSKHLILVEKDQISIIDFDGTNKAVIYAGSFNDSFVFPWPDSSRLVMISSLPTPTASEPNLYGINLK